MKKKRREGEHSEVDTVPISTRRRRGFAEPERSLEKKTEKRKRFARANARTRTHQRPPRGVNTRSKRVFMLFARNIAHSFPLKPSTTPHRSAEICPPTGGLGFTKGKNVSDSRAASDDANASSASTIDPRAVFASFRANSIAVQSNET